MPPFWVLKPYTARKWKSTPIHIQNVAGVDLMLPGWMSGERRRITFDWNAKAKEIEAAKDAEMKRMSSIEHATLPMGPLM